jgi:pimeloyl-ACP methyl ester carboxylesterase
MAGDPQSTGDAPAAKQKKPGSRVLRWLLRGLLVVLIIVVGLVVMGALYQTLATARDARRYPPSGRLIDVGGYKLHLLCEGTGSPTVVLDAANQGTVSNWIWIQSELAAGTRVCAYDRAGLGWSDLAPETQDATANAQALHVLLERAGESPPYVLVGHSLGGLYARMFAELYKEEVAGLVLIEGTHPNTFRTLGQPDVMPNAPDAGMMDAGPTVSRLGLLRLMGFPPTDPDLPEPQRSELQAYLASTKWAELIKRQYHVFPDLLAELRPLYAAHSLGSIPVAIVLSGNGDGGNPSLAELFAEEAALSDVHQTTLIEDATHISLVDREEHAAQSAAAIQAVVEQARQSQESP